MLTVAFWLSAGALLYAYAGYPLLLLLLSRVRGCQTAGTYPLDVLPTVSMIVPVHNERANLPAKIANTRALRYPAGRLEVIFVSDGSTDGTVEYVEAERDDRTVLVALPGRSGKAAALNAGLARAGHDIVVFTDAAIMLTPDALERIVVPFSVPAIGCVSGEDHIAQAGGEGLYGRYELFVRRQESCVGSLVGASGSFYAMRRSLCEPFVPNLAPDFLSVLRCVELGSRAVCEPAAAGTMAHVADPAEEFGRKVRTLLRGMTTLMQHAGLLNPLKYGFFSVQLLSHKLGRWLVPFLLVAILVTNTLLALESVFYATLLAGQLVLYGLAALGALRGADRVPGLARVSLYFVSVNIATAVAWGKFLGGVRQEIWTPSRR